MNKKYFIYIAAIVLTAISIYTAIYTALNTVKAATAPEVFISWEANTYIPAGYTGRALPVRGGTVSASVFIIERGKIVDLKKRNVRWFLNNNLIAFGNGVDSIMFTIPETAGGNQEIRAIVFGYGGKNLEENAAIPIADPEIVIDAPYPNKIVHAGRFTVRALPHFFNIKNIQGLNFSWEVNGAKAVENADIQDALTIDAINISPGTELHIRAAVTNWTNQEESTTQTVMLTIQ